MTNENKAKKKISWLETALIGIILVAVGITIVFFPKAAMSIVMIVAAVIFFVLGITDMVAAIRYKADTDSWKTTLGSGILTLLVSLFMGFTVYTPVEAMTIVVVLCVWAVVRCLLMLVGVIMGKVRRKGTILSSVILGIAGILVFLFRDVIAASTLIIGYVLMGAGIVALIVGFYGRAAGNEKTEAIEQQKRTDRLKTNANEALLSPAVPAPEETVSEKESEPEPAEETSEGPAFEQIPEEN